MAVTPIQFIRATTATATNGSDTIQIQGGIDCSSIQGGVAVQIGDQGIVEGIDGTVPDGSGNSTIKIRNAWSQPTITSTMVAFNSYEGLAEAIRRAREVVANISAIDELTGTGYIYKNGDGDYVVKASALDEDTQEKLASVNATTKEDFFALAKKCIRNDVASGFAEWGRQFNESSSVTAINEGMWAFNVVSNILQLGTGTTTNQFGTSRSSVPIAHVNGMSLKIDLVNRSDNPDQRNMVSLPDAPDGTETYNSATGTYVQHATSALAFAAETVDNKVITSRQDFVFLEVWHEKISDKGVVYPLGNVQYGTNSYEGITLSNSLVAQGYSAFGEWDTSTTGYGVTWDSLTSEQKDLFLQNEENNIYNDGGELIQVRYRMRVVKGLGDDWEQLGLVDTGNFKAWRYSEAVTDVDKIKPRGSATTFIDLGQTGTVNAGLYQLKDSGGWDTSPYENLGLVVGKDFDGNGLNSNAYEGRLFAIPIALVQRRNSGAYHPTLNPNGTRRCNTNASGGSGNLWHTSTSLTPISEAECFNIVDGTLDTTSRGGTLASGSIGLLNGRVDERDYDAIYASDVQDLRMSSRRRPLKEIREEAKRKAIAGEIRGFEGVPFTKVEALILNGRAPLVDSFSTSIAFEIQGVVAGDYIYLQQDDLTTYIKVKIESTDVSGNIPIVDGSAVGGIDRFEGQLAIVPRRQLHSQANPTWTDIIGDPVRIAATLPDGVEGEWIPEIPNGTSQIYHLNRKALDSSNDFTFTDNDGATWNNVSNAHDNTTNSTTATWGTTRVALKYYETQAHFTEDDANSEVLDLGVGYINHFHAKQRGGLLCSSLLDKVPTGQRDVDGFNVRGYSINEVKLIAGAVSNEPTHETPDIQPVEPTSPTVKTLDYLSVENGVAKLCYAYKEMVYDVTWGDNNKFEIIDNQSTLTDDNGNTVLYGTASFPTQYFIDESN